MEIDLADMRTFARALASRTRLRTLGEVSAAHELDVSQLSQRLGVSQPLMSWHLRHLRKAGLVRARREGRHVRYTLNRDALDSGHSDLTSLIRGFTAYDK